MAFLTFVKTLIQIPQRHRSRLPRNRRNHHFRRRPRHRHRHPLSLGAVCFSSSSDAVSQVAASPLFAPHPLFLSISIPVSPMISRIAITLAIDRIPNCECACPFRGFVRSTNRFPRSISRIVYYRTLWRNRRSRLPLDDRANQVSRSSRRRRTSRCASPDQL